MVNTNFELAVSDRTVITSIIHKYLEAVEDDISGYLAEKWDTDLLYEVMKGLGV